VGDLVYVLGRSFDLPVQWRQQFQNRSDLTLQGLRDLEVTDSFDKARGSAGPNPKTFATQQGSYERDVLRPCLNQSFPDRQTTTYVSSLIRSSVGLSVRLDPTRLS
jgi:hypothetical protein